MKKIGAVEGVKVFLEGFSGWDGVLRQGQNGGKRQSHICDAIGPNIFVFVA